MRSPESEDSVEPEYNTEIKKDTSLYRKNYREKQNLEIQKYQSCAEIDRKKIERKEINERLKEISIEHEKVYLLIKIVND